MAKFYILEVIKGKEIFREVEGEAVGIGGIMPCFRGYSHDNGFAAIFDAMTGSRVSHYEDNHEEAIVTAERWLTKNGLLRWRDRQMAFAAKYGSPPEPDIEVIREPCPVPCEGRVL